VPDAIKAVALPDHQRRLAWALTEAGEPVVAGDRDLVLPGGGALAWTDIERVSWKRPDLLVVEASEVEGSGAHHRLRLAGDGDLPGVVYDRVSGSVAFQTHEKLAPGGGVRLVGRRQPGRDDLRWQLVFDPGTDTSDPLVRAHAEQRLEAARRTIG
jgi:hypothetical protein